ncbi:hypothetical protein AKJ45_02465 [candidate division MSBL1 archaeon SCGC-AAA261F19]|uniref:Hydrogenase/sulfur reductase subunit alpha n=1 Tax=candidate division MSBL1 archaeon SCGC-AAA261F19 TaxID=1698275 RepID=A0A133V9L7_9EURY|nr:hypothetical protein AKJ45_02465 [candidate division MSBL1 archaeon SCGC-AAA261F19]
MIERVEGHVRVDIEVKPDGKKQVNFCISEGPRLFEGFLKGRKYDEIPFFVSRICGFCPIVHNLSAIKALENALNVSPTEQVLEFRRALNLMELIQSHSVHLYVMTLPDFADKKKNLFSIKSRFPKEVKKAIQLRNDVNSLIETLGGRAVHPLTTRVGGFSKLPTEEEMKEGLERLERMKPLAEDTVDLFAGLDYPDLDLETKYLSLGSDDKRYPIYDGYVISNKSEKFEPEEYPDIIKEETRPYSTAKFSTIGGEPFLTGALSRINLNGDYLTDDARAKMEEMEIDFPSYNPYHNNVAQAIEIVHSIDEINKIYKKLLSEISNKAGILEGDFEKKTEIDIKAGKGTDAVEAPRGTLYHYYELDENGFVKDIDILTPTAQSAANIELDLNTMLSEMDGLSRGGRNKKIKSLVRAYDPCVSCAVH